MVAAADMISNTKYRIDWYHCELCFEYHSFFWQINSFSASTVYSVSSLRQVHLIPFARVATAST